jgi:hypothetical protein
MAVAVIGGLVASTGLTLVMVPAAFTWVDDFERWLHRTVGRGMINATATVAPAPTPAPAPAANAAVS